MSNFMDRLAGSMFFQSVSTLLIYIFYGLVIGVSLTPSLILVSGIYRAVGGAWPNGSLSLLNALIIGLSLGISLFVFFIFGILVSGTIIRLMSLGVKPGTYPVTSPTMFRWLVYSGVYNLVVQMIMPVIPMTLFSRLFFRLMGCRIGKNVQINTGMLNDCYLLTIEDDVIIGGQTDISCHIFENGKLTLKPIRIGRGCLIGAHCYISPGVVIGEGSIIGLNSFIRQDRVLPPGSRITSVAGVDFQTARRIEKGLAGSGSHRKRDTSI